MSHAKKEMLSFFVTTKCNLDCEYCYTNKKKHGHQSIPLKFAKLGIDSYLEKGGKRHLRFFGAGEPTVEFNLLRDIHDYAANKRDSGLSFEIQTNGVFSEEVRSWLSGNVDIIWISMDGPPDIQDTYRKTVKKEPTSQTIEENVKYLIRNGKGITGIRVTITSLNINRQAEMIEYFSALGVKHIWSDPIFPSVGEDNALEEIDTMEYAKNFLDCQDLARRLGVFYGSILTCNFDEKTHYNCRACLPVPHLTTDGYVSACDMALFGSKPNHMSVFIYGVWNREKNQIIYDEDKIEILRSRRTENMELCRDCEAKYNCAGYCLGEVVNETKSLFGQKTKVCEPIRFLHRNMAINKGRYEFLHP